VAHPTNPFFPHSSYQHYGLRPHTTANVKTCNWFWNKVLTSGSRYMPQAHSCLGKTKQNSTLTKRCDSYSMYLKPFGRGAGHLQFSTPFM
jgi:hypothetical protein